MSKNILLGRNNYSFIIQGIGYAHFSNFSLVFRSVRKTTETWLKNCKIHWNYYFYELK